MNYGLSYRERHNLNESALTDAQRTLHYIAENMRMEKSISEDGYKHFQQAIEALSGSEKPNKWIPVSERYPTDENKRYLVCYEDGCITIEYLYFDGAGYPFFSEMELGVIAWMPFIVPEPYKASPTGAESEDKE